MSRRCLVLSWFTTSSISSKLVYASQHTCQHDCAFEGTAIIGESLLQKKIENAARNPESLQLSDEDPKASRGINQTCHLKSPWFPINWTPQHDMSFENYNDMPKGNPEFPFQQGLFVHPPSKFAFCLIEKNACSTWIGSVLQPLLDNQPAQDCFAKVNYVVATMSQMKFGQEGIESVFHDPEAIRAVFLRDPLERFVSAFFNKCVQPTDDPWNCIINDGDPESPSKVFKDVVKEALKRNLSTSNPHWSPQADHCELRTYLPAYNAIGLMQSSVFEDDMNCVLAHAGLERFSKKEHCNPNPSGAGSLTVAATKAEKKEQRNLNPTAMGRANQLTPAIVLQKMFPQDVARQLIDHMDDYDVFSFPREPEWLKGATGEWYDLDPSSMVSFISRTAQKYKETDDIVELAIRRGYAA